MFGLIRTAILVLIAFFLGLMFERAQASEACSVHGGTFVEGICRGVMQ